MPFEYNTKNRVCNYYYVRDSGLPGDKHLLRCSNCKDCFYSSKEAQKLHWKLAHKHVCKKDYEDVNAQHPLVQSQLKDPLSCMGLLGTAYYGGLGISLLTERPRTMLHCVQALHKFPADDRMYMEKTTEQGKALFENILKPLHNMCSSPEHAPDLDRLWAIPGFANYFLSDEVLLSQAMRDAKARGDEAPPSEQFGGDIDISKKGFECSNMILHSSQGYLLNKSKLDPSVQLNAAYCDFVKKLYFSSALTPGGDGKGNMELKKTPLARAVVEQCMRLWLCPYTRASVPSLDSEFEYQRHSIGRSELFCYLFKLAYEDTSMKRKDDELVPGMTPKQLLRVLIEDATICHTLSAAPMRILDLFKQLMASTDEREDVWKRSMGKESDIVEIIQLMEDSEWNPPNIIVPGKEMDIRDLLMGVLQACRD